MFFSFLSEEHILAASFCSETFIITPLGPFLLLDYWHSSTFESLKGLQNSAFQSVIVTCLWNTGQFQTLTSGVLTIAPALML